MKMNLFAEALIKGEPNIWVTLLISVCAIVLVFLILYIIVLCIQGMQKIISKNAGKEKTETEALATPKQEVVKSVDIEDEDMMVAALVATIDYTNETKKDVRLKSIKRIG